MSLHTFVIDGRKRLQISQSKTEPGKVLVQVLDSARDVLVSCTMDAQAAAVVSQALELEAVAAENSQLADLAGRRCGCGAEFPKCGMSRCAGREIREAQKAVKKIGPALVQAYADTNGVPPMRALPVMDVAQVGA